MKIAPFDLLFCAIFTTALIAEDFLKQTASQLTYPGLHALMGTLKEEQLCVFFRNNHFSTLLKHKVRRRQKNHNFTC